MDNTISSLNSLGRKIFFDRYALKDTTKKSLKKNDLVSISPKLIFTLTKRGVKKSLEIIKVLYQGKLL